MQIFTKNPINVTKKISVALEQIWKWSFSTLFGSTSTIGRFGGRFRDGKCSLLSLFCLLFFYSRCPRAQSFVKVEIHVPLRAPWSRRHWKILFPIAWK